MLGHLAVFDQWTKIDSAIEGTFMERIAPGAFTRTIAEDAIRVTFQHGKDPTLGDQVLGPIDILREDAQGAYYEVPLLDGVPPLVVSGLRAGVYGASFRFSVRREDVERSVQPSELNPDALPERTIRDVRLFEFGPVTWPAYAGATAGLRSRTWGPARRSRALVLLRAQGRA